MLSSVEREIFNMTRLYLYDTRNNHSQTAAWWWEIGEQNAYLIWAAIIRRSREDRGPPSLAGDGSQTKNALISKFSTNKSNKKDVPVQMKFYVGPYRTVLLLVYSRFSTARLQ